jgi:hypothetical protein
MAGQTANAIRQTSDFLSTLRFVERRARLSNFDIVWVFTFVIEQP